MAMEKFSKKKWIQFAKETMKGDNTNHLKADLSKFADLMSKVHKKNGAIQSVIWLTVNPCGTEDRTWVRTFLCLEGFAEYKKMPKSLDKAHVEIIIQQFKEVTNV